LVLVSLLLSGCTPPATQTPAAQASATPHSSASAQAVTATTAASVAPAATLKSAAEYLSETPCDHPYLPLRPGTKWGLNTAEVVMTLEVNQVVEGAEMTAATSTRSYDFGERYEQSWTCTSDGIRYDDIIYADPNSRVALPIAVIEHTGLYLPSADKLVVGYSWDEHSVTVNRGYTITMDLHYTVESTDPVTAIQQTVSGVQVRVSGEMRAVDKDGKETVRSVNFLRVFGLGIGVVLDDALRLQRMQVTY